MGRVVFLFVILWILNPPLLNAQPVPGIEELLGRIYPKPATFTRKVSYLLREEVENLEKVAGVAFPSRMILTYKIELTSAVTHYAYLDIHRVRTKEEALLVILDERERIARIEVLWNLEPEEYHPPPRWLKTRENLLLTDPETRNLPPLTGATLTTRAVGEAIRRVQVLHPYLKGKGFFR